MSPRTLALSALAVLLAPRPALAAAAHDFQRDPVEHHMATVLTWTLGIAIAFALLCLVRVWRGKVTGLAGKVALVVAVALLPTLTVSAGMVLALVRAERVEFCGSCHGAMRDYVLDMEDPESESLAALHYRNQYIPEGQCYACHTSYGLFGTFRAKANGVLEVLRYYTGSWERPIRMREPYRNGDCLKCHARSAKWRAVDLHVEAEVRDRMFRERFSCMKCHGRSNPAHAVARGDGE